MDVRLAESSGASSPGLDVGPIQSGLARHGPTRLWQEPALAPRVNGLRSDVQAASRSRPTRLESVLGACFHLAAAWADCSVDRYRWQAEIRTGRNPRAKATTADALRGDDARAGGGLDVLYPDFR